MTLEINKITYECNKFHLNIETELSFREILIPISDDKGKELFTIIPEIFSTAAKMKIQELEK